MNIQRARHLFKWLVDTPFHPQWLISRNYTDYLKGLGGTLHGKVLDVGCGHQAIRQYLGEDINYTGVDNYYTATSLYKNQPDVYVDSGFLPFRQNSYDVVLLLDVIEHVPSSQKILNDIHRVLKVDGSLYLQIPFLYPIHDAPLDYYRWTESGLNLLLADSGFSIVKIEARGTALETSVLLMNIALCKTVLNAWNDRSPVILIIIILPFIIPLLNLFAVVISRFTDTDYFMPYRYRVLAKKI